MFKAVLLLLFLFSFALSLRQPWEKRLAEGLFGDLPNIKIDPNAPLLEPTYRRAKRFELQSAEVPVSSWDFPIVNWAIVTPTLVFAISDRHSILVSRDSLFTFTEYPQIPSSAVSREAWHNEFFPNDIMILGNKMIFVSQDQGTTFTSQTLNVSLRSIKFHPVDRNLALAWNYDERKSQRQQPTDLYFTRNLGKTWTKILSSVSQFNWCRAGLGNISNGRICVIQTSQFKFTNSYGQKDWHVPVAGAAAWMSIHDRFFTLLATESGTFHFFISADDGTTFHRAVLPRGVSVGDIARSSFVEDSNGVIWIVVNPDPIVRDKSQKGNLYTSDADGYEFSLVLRDVHTYNGYWDIDLIRFMEGTLFANTLLDADSDSLKLRTKITYDNGDTWEPLESPETDVNGNRYNCPRGQTCNLNLFGITTWLGAGGDGYFGDLYTQPDAVGLIAGTGNVGNYLNTTQESINTYLSRDGGLTWDEIMDVSTIYDFGDFGGLLVLAPNQVQTNKVYYSWDGGKTLSSITLPKTVVIFNIITISSHAETFLVLAYELVGTIKYRRIYGLDFSKLHTRDCTDADYEEWIPHNGVRGPNCVLGHNTVYRRRKRDSACYTEEDINKIVNVTNCQCTEDDYECDVNFDRTEGSGKCAYEGTDLDIISRENGCANNESTYKFSSGYRKIPGDTCVNELDKYKPVVRQCPNAPTPNVPTPAEPVPEPTMVPMLGLAVGMTMLVLVALVVGFCFGVRDERVRKMFPWLNQAPSWVTAGYSNSLVVAEMGDEFEDDNVRSEVDLSTSLSDDE